jgi:hypothetical protein
MLAFSCTEADLLYFTEVPNKKDMETEIERFGNNIHK